MPLRVEGSRALAPSFSVLDALCDSGGHDAFVIGKFFIFAPRRERPVNRNHVVGAVCLVRVDG